VDSTVGRVAQQNRLRRRRQIASPIAAKLQVELYGSAQKNQRTQYASEQEGQHPLTGQRATNFRLLANQ